MIKLDETYPLKVTLATAEYPDGSFKTEEFIDGVKQNVGTPLDIAYLNDEQGFNDALMSEAGLVKSGNPDTALESQKLDAIKIVAESISLAAIQPLESRVSAVETGQSSGTVGYTTQALLFADLAHDEKTVAYVTNDTTATNNGTYTKSGATGVGSWVQASSDLASQAYQLATENKETLTDSTQDIEIITGANSDMSGANDWAVGLGSPVITIADGEMEVDFPSGTNAAIKLSNILVIGDKYQLKVKVKLVSGVSSLVQIGSSFLGAVSAGDSGTLTRPSLEESYEIFQDITATSTEFWIGVAAGDNNGSVISVESVELLKVGVTSASLRKRIDETSIDASGSALDSYTSTARYPNEWVQGAGFPSINYNSENSMKIDLSQGEDAYIKVADALTPSTDYKVKISMRVDSGTASQLFLGNFASSVPFVALVTPTSDFAEYNLEFTSTPSGTDFFIGSLAADNNGVTVEIESVQVTESSADSDEIEKLESDVDLLNRGSILSLNDEGMTEPTNWIGQLGNPALDYTTNAGDLTVDLGVGINRSIKIETPQLEIGTTYDIEVTMKVDSGNISAITIGTFTGNTGQEVALITPTYEYETYKFSIVSASNYFAIGATTANNNGTVIAISKVVIKDREERINNIEYRVTELESSEVIYPQKFATEGFMTSLSRYDKPLIKFCVAGDSLMANAVGGDIPVELDEGAGYRPIRLDVNSVPRRIYDHVSFNKAEHRRLDVVEWLKSGTWTTVSNSTVWEPAHTETLYHTTSQANAYVEIVIPDGMENFALTCQKDVGFGSLDVTLNGGDISAYGDSTINLQRTATGTGDIGNPYYTLEYLNLPSGVNTIRVAKQNDTLECRVWGGFYWTGTTLVVHNIAHGGHSLQNLLTQHLDAELLENDFDAILFEITIMNEMSKGRSPAETVLDLKTIINNYLPNKDIMFMTPNPFGDNGAGTNYYADFQDPSMEDTSNACVEYLSGAGVPYVNVFDIFKKKILNRGGTLLGGEGGLWYTTDGQHGNVEGVREWFNLIKPDVSNKPFS